MIEAVTSLSILVISVSLIVGGYVYLEKNSQDQITQDTLDLDLRLAVNRLQQEMLLTSLSEMLYAPAGAQKFAAISFPSFQSGSIETEEAGAFWDTTIIYHVHGSGAEQRLLRTVFIPRDNTLSTAERQAQLDQVVADGHGHNAENGTHASTTCLFQHVFDWSIEPQGSSYDGYSDQLHLDQGASLGSIQMDAGEHTLTITSTGKDSRSTGYKVGLDTLRLSTSGLEREAEAQVADGTPKPVPEYNASGTWSGYHQLTFEPSSVGDSFEVSFYNDRWEDTNFDQIGGVKSNVTVNGIDANYSPADLALRLNGNSTNWQASVQTGDLTGMSWTGNAFAGAAVRVLLRGSDMAYGNSLLHDGLKCRLAFSSTADGPLHIRKAYIDELRKAYDPSPDTRGTPVQVTFGSLNACSIPAGATVFSDFIDFPIQVGSSYAVTFLVDTDAEQSHPLIWKEANHVTGAFMIPGSSTPDLACLTETTNWSSRADVVQMDAVIAVDMLHTTYPQAGTYVSAPVDTQMESPRLESIEWTEDCPDGTALKIKVRSGNAPDMSDAPAWQDVSAMPSPGYLTSIDYKRYVQYQATLYSHTGFNTPKLRDLSIQWPGQTRVVDVGGIFVNGPEYGQFEARIDDQSLSSPLRVTLQLREDIRGYNNTTKTMYAEGSFELTPRNSRSN